MILGKVGGEGDGGVLGYTLFWGTKKCCDLIWI